MNIYTFFLLFFLKGILFFIFYVIIKIVKILFVFICYERNDSMLEAGVNAPYFELPDKDEMLLN